MRPRKQWLLINLFALFLSFLAGVVYQLDAIQRLEFNIADEWFRLRGSMEPPNEVAIAAIDDDTLQHLGLAPINPVPRESFAALISRLREAGAKAIVFDLVFKGKGPSEEADMRLAEALASFPSVIASDMGSLGASVRSRYEDGRPLELFAKNARALGRYLAATDFNVMRRFQPRLLPSSPEAPSHSLAEVAANIYGMAEEERPKPQDMVNFYGPAGTLTNVPMYHLLEGREDALLAMKDKVVFVGSYKKALSKIISIEDNFYTPFGGMKTFGVEIHATMAANLIRGDWIRRAPLVEESYALIVGVFLICVLMLSLKPYWSVLILLGIGGAWALASYHLFVHKQFFLPGLFATLIVFPAIFLFCTLYYYITVYRVQRRTREAFERYLSPAMVDRIVESDKSPELGGELVEVTLLFTDMAGFTRWAERMPPQEVCTGANAYYTQIARPVMDSGGTLIKFLGDGMFALWGAPLPIGRPSDAALQSALQIREVAGSLRAFEGLPPLATRIGIHRGRVIVGNFGSSQRFDYTAVGDAVNTTSRLEGLNKQFGTSIILSEAVRRDLRGPFEAVPLGKVVVVGRAEAMNVYTLFETHLDERVMLHWTSALKAFEQRDWHEAARLFQITAASCTGLEKAAELYQEFIKGVAGSGLQESWEGELVFQVK